MKEYRGFIIAFSVLLALYIVTELNKPKPVDWSVTLNKDDKIPYGGFIIFNQIKKLFPASVTSFYRTPLYQRLHNSERKNTVYLIISPSFKPSPADMNEMKDYMSRGNYIFVSAIEYQKSFLDSFGLATKTRYSFPGKDSASTNFVNPALTAPENYTFFSSTIDQYFYRVDTSRTVVLGINNHKEPDFIKLKFGAGALFVHANPACFSNYFLLHKNNAGYSSKALSYVPAGVSNVYWDEYYKAGREGATTPLRFLLSNEYLRWALRLALVGLVLFVLFQAKRKQRIIPVIEPLQNSSLDFIKTVSGVYFNAKDNEGIADKKISYFLEFIRQRFNLSTQLLDDDFTRQLVRKSGVSTEDTNELLRLINNVNSGHGVSDRTLLLLNNTIDNFYKQV